MSDQKLVQQRVIIMWCATVLDLGHVPPRNSHPWFYIIAISQSYLNDRHLQYEFNVAQMCNVDEPDFSLILNAKEPGRDR